MKNNKKMTSGITLIALVVTIIVLLILAGISIMMLTGNNGIISRAGEAREKTETGNEKERIQLAYISAVGKSVIEDSNLLKEMNQELKNNNIKGTASRAGKAIKVTLDNGTIYAIDENGMIDEYKKAEISPVYVVIYEGGEMVFSQNEEKDILRTILYDGSDENISNTEFNSSDEVLWKDYVNQITKVTFKDKISPKYTSFWFRDCVNLTIINGIKLLDTSNVENMQYMFYGCSSLTKLDLSDFNTSEVTNMKAMFSTCIALKSLDISNFNTSKVTNIRSMFAVCISLEILDLRSFETQEVEDMYGMFMGHSTIGDMSLKKIKGLENFNTEKVKNMGSMFQRCIYLEDLDLRSFNTSNVINMKTMFYRCSALKTILGLENFDTSNVTQISSMFGNCSNLSGIITIKCNITDNANNNSVFSYASTVDGTKITVKYTSNVSEDMINTLENTVTGNVEFIAI